MGFISAQRAPDARIPPWSLQIVLWSLKHHPACSAWFHLFLMKCIEDVRGERVLNLFKRRMSERSNWNEKQLFNRKVACTCESIHIYKYIYMYIYSLIFINKAGLERPRRNVMCRTKNNLY